MWRWVDRSKRTSETTDPAGIKAANVAFDMPISNLDVLAYSDSPIGAICLRRRKLLSIPGTIVTEITVDHQLLMSSYHTASEQALARCALERHSGDGLSVMIGGLGLGYTVQEALASPAVASVDAVELLPQVVGWMKNGLVPLSDELNSDPRFAVVEGDVYAMLSSPPERLYDLILIDVDHSPDEPLAPANAFFYTEEGLERAKRHLEPGGLLGVWSYAESSPFVRAMRKVFARVDVEPVVFDNDLTEETETNWLFLGLTD